MTANELRLLARRQAWELLDLLARAPPRGQKFGTYRPQPPGSWSFRVVCDRLALAPTTTNRLLDEMCGVGWVMHDPGQGYRLTLRGRQMRRAARRVVRTGRGPTAK